MLSLENIHAYYGKSHIIHDASLEVKQNEVVGLLGRNGVGKTTLLRSILGLFPPRTEGRIIFQGQNISHHSSYKVAGLGIGYVPQGRRIFPHLSILENLKVACPTKTDQSRFEEVFDYFPILREKSAEKGRNLSGGQQQMLAIGRAIMSHSCLMLIDEPTEGLQPSIVRSVRTTIKQLTSRGVTILLADQNLENILELCDTVYVIEKGTIKLKEQRANLNLSILHDFLGVKKKARRNHEHESTD